MFNPSYRNAHQGETILIIGNAKNLYLTPPESFNCATIGLNTIHKYQPAAGQWIPDYYVAVDRRVAKEFGNAISERLWRTPKFVPERVLKYWHGHNFQAFRTMPGPGLWSPNKGSLWQKDPARELISYGNVMHVALKLAQLMNPARILIIGMEHDPANFRDHFWGLDQGMGFGADLKGWIEGYRQLRIGLESLGIEVLNISPNTFVSADAIPHDDFRKYQRIKTKSMMI